jgi:hypothetical protein
MSLLQTYKNPNIALYDPLEPGTTTPFGVRMHGLDVIENPNSFKRLVNQDHGISANKKNSIFQILNSPEAFDNLVAGAAGYALTRAITSYSELSKPARTLLSLAGFGAGSIIYNTMRDRKFTDYDPKTGTMTVKLNHEHH